jgi:hypothetical protein
VPLLSQYPNANAGMAMIPDFHTALQLSIKFGLEIKTFQSIPTIIFPPDPQHGGADEQNSFGIGSAELATYSPLTLQIEP